MTPDKIKEKLEILSQEENFQKADAYGIYWFRTRTLNESIQIQDEFLKNGRIKFEQHSDRIKYLMAEHGKAALHRDECVKSIRQEYTQKRRELTQPEDKQETTTTESKKPVAQAVDAPDPAQEKNDLLEREEKMRLNEIRQTFVQQVSDTETQMQLQEKRLNEGRLSIREYNDEMNALAEKWDQANLHLVDNVNATRKEYARKRSEGFQTKSEQDSESLPQQENQSVALTPEQAKKAERTRLIAEFQEMKRQNTKKIRRII